MSNRESGGRPENERHGRKLPRPDAVSQKPLVRTRTLVTVVGVFVIPVIAGFLLLFYDAWMVGAVTVALYASLWLLFNPFPALLLYMLLVAVRPQEGIAQLEAMHVERLCAVLAMLGWGLQAAVVGRVRPISRSITAWLLAFIVVCFLSIFTSVWKLAAVNAWIDVLKLGVLFFLIAQLVDTPRRLFVFLLVFALGNVWMASESMRLYFAEGYDYVEMGIVRATTASVSRGDPNMLAATMLLAICLGFYTIASHARFLWRLSWLAVIGAGSVVIVLTGSRAAMLASLFLLFYIWITSKRKLPVGIVVVLVVVAAWFAMPLQYQDRFLTTFDSERNPSATESVRGRMKALRVGIEMFTDRPLLGVGIGNFGVAHGMLYSPPERASWLQAHNLVAQVGGETGILGLLAFGGFVIACMRQGARVRSSLSSVHTPEARGLTAVCRASLGICWLLLFFGLFAHNLMRYNWYLNAGLISACATMASSLVDKHRVDKAREPHAS